MLTQSNVTSSPVLSEVTVQVSPQEADARLDRKIEPEYPAKALAAGIQGDVVLRVLIGRNGKVKDIKVASGDPVLAHAAVSAVKRWRYEPWASGGNNPETETTVTLSFVLAKSPMACPGQEPGLYSFAPDARTDRSTQELATGQIPSTTEVFKVGGDVKPPRALYAPDPEYSESARIHKRQGLGVLRIIVTPQGEVARIRVERVVGFGLDQKAIKAVCQWRFQPAHRDGEAVPVEIDVEVSFRLY
jgi:TonB family protein